MSKKKINKSNNTKLNISKNHDFFYKNKFWLLSSLLLFTFVLYYRAIFFSFLSNWDDYDLIIKNNYVTSFAINGFKTFYNYKILNHDPLTLVSHAITYKYWADNPLPYHLVNVILHLANIVLVFALMIRIEKKYFFAFIVTVLFAIHPFRVESVAWVAERKDVLFSFFFLLSLIFYLNFLNRIWKNWSLFFSFLAFIASLLCKFSAITLPAILILIDWYKNRQFKASVLIEKLIFLIPAILMIFLHFSFKENLVGNDFIYISYSGIDRIFFPPYSLLYYIVNVLFPFKLAVIHQYPDKINGLLPIIYYFSMPIIVSLAVGLVFISKKITRINKLVWFGLLFFLINISIVLHFIPFGGNIIVGERYTYMAYIGLFIIIAFGLQTLKNANNLRPKPIKNLIFLISAIYLAILTIVCYKRINVWKNSITLFEDAVAKFPKSDYAFFALGCAFNDTKDFNNALNVFNKALELKPYYKDALNNRARARFELGDHSGAINDCDNLILLDSTYAFAYYNKANALAMYQKYEEAAQNLDKAIKFDPNFSEAYNNRGNTKAIKGDFNAAKADFSKAIALNPTLADAYVNLGLVYLHEQNKNEYCNCWQKAKELGSEKANSLYNNNCNN